MIHELDTNQTQFSQDQPLLQDIVTAQAPFAPQPEKVDEKESERRKKLIIGGAVVTTVVLLFLLLLLLVVFRKPPQITEVLLPSPSPSSVVQTTNPLKERVKNLQDELDVADPTNQNLVFPPVKMEIFLDQVDT